ncbi:unnamed protein product [Malus baccata var. baccata]
MFSVSITCVIFIWRSSILSLPAVLPLLHVRHYVILVPHKPIVSATTKAIHDAILLYGRVDGSMVELEPHFKKTSPPSISKVHQSFLWPPKLIENSENLISFAFGCELLSQNCLELFVCGTALHFVFWFFVFFLSICGLSIAKRGGSCYYKL